VRRPLALLLVSLAGNGWLRGVQELRRPVRYVLAGSLVSLVLCPLLVHPVGLGLVGDESIPSSPLLPLVQRARARGLRFMPHAGQVGDASVVREAVEVLKADRIAHGVSAVDDASLLNVLATRDICLCVCPSSNARIGRQPDFRMLAASGVALTVNSDDPAMVGTTLTHELDLAEADHGLRRDDMISAAWRYSFK